MILQYGDRLKSGLVKTGTNSAITPKAFKARVHSVPWRVFDADHNYLCQVARSERHPLWLEDIFDPLEAMEFLKDTGAVNPLTGFTYFDEDGVARPENNIREENIGGYSWTTGRIKSRLGVSRWKAAVFKRDNHKCVGTDNLGSRKICSSTGDCRSAVEACHIKPVFLCKKGEDIDVDNGITFVWWLHRAFDAGDVMFSCRGKPIIRYGSGLSGAKINRLQLTPGQQEYINGHREWAIKNWS